MQHPLAASGPPPAPLYTTSDLLRLLAADSHPFAAVAEAVATRFGGGTDSQAWLERTLVTLLRDGLLYTEAEKLNAAYLLRFAAPAGPGAREALVRLALADDGEPPAVRAWAGALLAPSPGLDGSNGNSGSLGSLGSSPASSPSWNGQQHAQGAALAAAAMMHQRTPRQVLAEAAAPLDSHIAFCRLPLGQPPPPLPWQGSAAAPLAYDSAPPSSPAAPTALPPWLQQQHPFSTHQQNPFSPQQHPQSPQLHPMSPQAQPMSPLHQPPSPLQRALSPLQQLQQQHQQQQQQPMSPLHQPASPLQRTLSPLQQLEHQHHHHPQQPMSPLHQPDSPLQRTLSPLQQLQLQHQQQQQPMSPLHQHASPLQRTLSPLQQLQQQHQQQQQQQQQPMSPRMLPPPMQAAPQQQYLNEAWQAAEAARQHHMRMAHQAREQEVVGLRALLQQATIAPLVPAVQQQLSQALRSPLSAALTLPLAAAVNGSGGGSTNGGGAVLQPHHMRGLVEQNCSVAAELLLALLAHHPDAAAVYCAAVAQLPMSAQSVECLSAVVASGGELPGWVLATFVASCMQDTAACMDAGRQSRHVKLLCACVALVLQRQPMALAESLPELLSFCIQQSRHKPAADLYRQLRDLEAAAG